MNEAEIRLKRALAAAGFAVWDASLVAQQVVAGQLTWSADGAALLGRHVFDQQYPVVEFLQHVHPHDRSDVIAAMQRAADGDLHCAIDYRVIWPDGSLHWLTTTADILLDEHGTPVRMLGILRDITQEKQAMRDLQLLKERAEVTLWSIGDGVLTTDAAGHVQCMNRIAEQLTGWTKADAVGIAIEDVFHIVDELSEDAFENPVRKCLRLNQTVAVSNRSALISRTGHRIAIEDTAAPIRGTDGATLGAVIVFHDVSHERQLRHELSWQASHDALTGLINRREFEFQVVGALASAKADGHTHALLYLDLDQFKIVNDTCGHGAGDVLLQHLASLLQSHMRDSDVLARLGGDELGVLLLNCPARQAVALAEKLREAIKDYRFVWNHNTFEVGASIGLVVIDEHSKSTSELLSAADQACYVAKEQGRNRVHVYQETDLVLAKRHGDILWVSRLNDAFDKQRFQLFVQPIASLKGARMQHVEVLLRMQDDGNRLILPGAFIPAAERYDLMVSIDRWVIDPVCQYLMNQRQRSGNPIDARVFSINLSGVSLNDDQLHDYIIDRFNRYHTAPSQICFEITETAAVANLNKAKLFMTRLQGIGVQFSLDDFGSGLSSFAYLKSLPVNFLKIDGLFVRDIATNEINRAMVAAINEVGHVMGIKTVAEYVETPEVLAAVRAIGIDFAQGFAISGLQPLTAYQSERSRNSA
ncbi:MAG: EAL domain-containing protein [Herminiimonas sp.]|nr:EAL domain-containing protein [Herminiimonas sp.]